MCPFGHEQMQQQQKTQRNTVARQTQRNLPFFDAQLNMEEQQIDYYSPTSIDGYRGLLDKLKDLQPDGIEIAEPVQDENVGFKERRNREKQRAQQLEQQKEQYKILGKTQGLLRFKDVASLNLLRSNDGKKTWMQEKLPHSQLTRQETLRNILDENDYSNFENLDSVMRNVVASSALSKFIQEYNVTEESNPETLCKEIQERTEGVSGLLNPALRLALSLAQRTPGISDEMKQIFRRLDEAMSTAVMVATLTHEPDQSKVEQYFRNKGEENPSQRAQKAVVANRAQQIQIAKRLLLMQLSNFQKINDKNGGDEPWDKSMAVALSHCSRVVLTLPRQEDGEYNTKEDHKNMWQSILTVNGGNAAQDNSRASSTHSIKRRKVGNSSVGSQEKKVLFNLVGQRGMNCAIGGLGNAGISKKTLCNDGSCGHFYSMHKEADKTHYGSMLMGLESDAAGIMNQMGHTHDIHATPEKASSLGGQRVDEVGKKYGGRQCDLTAISASDISIWMTGLENYIQSYNRSMARPGQYFEAEKDNYRKIISMLAGEKMTKEQWCEFRSITGIQFFSADRKKFAWQWKG